MNNFFKMSLVAAAVAVTGTATAGTFTPNDATTPAFNENAVQFSKEGATAGVLAAEQYLPTVSYKLGAAYITGDELTITLTGAAITSDSVFPQTITVGTANFDKVALTLTPEASVKYRVISGTANAGSVFTLPQEKVSVADKTDKTKNGVVVKTGTELVALRVNAAATTNNGTTAYDLDTSVANSRIMALNTLSQFGTLAISNKLNAVIDGNAKVPSTVFLNGETSDSLTLTYTAPKSLPTQAVVGQNIGLNDLTATPVVQTVKLESDVVLAVEAAKYTVTSKVITLAANITAGAGDTVATNAMWTLVYPNGTSPVSDVISITPKAGTGAPVMTDGAFDLVATANTVDLLSADDAAVGAAGAWTTAKSVTYNVPYMPYGTGLSQVIYATNTTVSDAEVAVIAKDEAGTKYDLEVVASIPAGGVSKLSTVIKNALAAKGFDSGKVSLDVTFRGNSVDTSGSIKLHSGYNANASDRGFVTNTSNGAK